MERLEIRLKARVFDLVLAVHPAIPAKVCIEEFTSGAMKVKSLPSLTMKMRIYRLAVWERDPAARIVEELVLSIKSSNMFEA